MSTKHRHICSLCEALCGIEVEVDRGVVGAIRGDKTDPLSQGHVCPKAVALKDLHTDPDRVRHPLRREGDRWVEVSWEEALDEAAERLVAVQEAHGRTAVASYLGNPNAHHYGSLISVPMALRAIRSRSRFSATSSDQLPQMLAAERMFGHPLLIPVPDLDRCDFLVVLGANPYASNGSLMTTGGVRRRIEGIVARGGEVVVVDPRRTETAQHATTHHFIRPGTDALWLLSLVRVLFDEGLVDQGAWRGWTDGVEDLDRLSRGFEPEATAAATGVSVEATKRVARKLAETPRAALYARIGVCTQRFGGLASWLAWCVDVLIGGLDRPGGMMFTTPAVDVPHLSSRMGVSGHLGVWKSRVRGLPEFSGELPVATMAEEMETPGEGQIRALLTVAGNPVLSAPNGARIEAALPGLDFMVSVDMYINETTRHADLILPPPSGLERDHYGLVFHALAVRNTARYAAPAVAAPPGVREDWDILLDLAARISRRKGDRRQAWSLEATRRLGMRRILDGLLRMGPHGRRVPVWGEGLTLGALEAQPEGFDLGPLESRLPERLMHADRRVHLSDTLYEEDVDRLRTEWSSGRLVVDSMVLIGRRQLRSNNSWLHNSHRLVKGKPRCTLLVHPEDAEERGLSDGAEAVVRSRVGEVRVPVQVSDEIMRGVVSLPHGWGHGRRRIRQRIAAEHAGVSVNDLTDEQWIDPLTGNAGFNGVPVEVRAG